MIIKFWSVSNDDHRGVSHIFTLLLVVLALAIGGTYALVSSKADQIASTTRRKRYYYQPLSNAQSKKIKKVAAQYWGGICNNGKNLKLDYYWGPIRVPDISNPDDQGLGTNFGLDLDAAAFVIQQPSRNPRSQEYCKVHVNGAILKAVMDKGKKYTTKRMACFLFTHEVGHIAGRPDYGFGEFNKAYTYATKHDWRELIMSYDYEWGAIEGRNYSKGVGPKYCHQIR